MLKHTLLLFVGSVALVVANETSKPLQAIAKLTGPSPTVQGNVTFMQEGDTVRILGTIVGLPPCTTHTCARGFHIHEKGDITGGCASAGAHFNPENKSHGHPNDAERHVGDLGNVNIDENGTIQLNFVDKKISLVGPFSIIGRSVVLHKDTDDYGKGNASDSKKTGHAGDRVACGVVGILNPLGSWTVRNGATIASYSMAIFIPILFLVFTI